MNTYTSELLRRAQFYGMDPATADAGATVGAAIDAGIITLTAVLADVRSCSNRAELDAKLLALAADVALLEHVEQDDVADGTGLPVEDTTSNAGVVLGVAADQVRDGGPRDAQLEGIEVV